MKIKRLIPLVAMIMLVTGASPALAQDPQFETPDAEEYVSPVVTMVRESLPGIVPPPVVDPVAITDVLDTIVVESPAEPAPINQGDVGCLPGTTGPFIVNGAMEVKGSGTWACDERAWEISIAVWVEVKLPGRWATIDASEAFGEEVNKDDVISRKTRGYCKPGKYKYRIGMIGRAMNRNGTERQITEFHGSPKELTCRTFL